MDTTESMETKDLEKFKTEVSGVYEIEAKSQAIEITTPVEFEHALSFTRQIKARYANLDNLRKDITRPLDESKRRIMEIFKKPAEVLSRCEYMVKGKILQYQHTQEEWRKKEEEKLRKETDAEREKLLKKAAKLEKNGDETKAEELREQAAGIVAPAAVQLEQPANGLHTKKLWKAKIINAEIVPRSYMIPNQEMLDSIARASHGMLSIPGVEFYFEEVIAITRD
jgi:hypothetical protein